VKENDTVTVTVTVNEQPIPSLFHLVFLRRPRMGRTLLNKYPVTVTVTVDSAVPGKELWDSGRLCAGEGHGHSQGIFMLATHPGRRVTYSNPTRPRGPMQQNGWEISLLKSFVVSCPTCAPTCDFRNRSLPF
jgi:hypothetical protein